jgi:hypothetical protein
VVRQAHSSICLGTGWPEYIARPGAADPHRSKQRTYEKRACCHSDKLEGSRSLLMVGR